MNQQPNKPGGDVRADGKVRDPGDEQAVKNQGGTTPEAYPKKDGGRATGEDSARGAGRGASDGQ
ncbi:hypothetical protein [Sphingomonas sp. BK235]|uniref:hypothetical protein n=1 Tax=Sphingomonas sp. BK235 TaxID=2512131 RepID=UPI001045D204|nr:hypothetical protein [Sphingomonas sp. BK235]TCP35790.1 hypothetical protein EV292_102379 [Sphingomonas sp. BK235]